MASLLQSSWQWWQYLDPLFPVKTKAESAVQTSILFVRLPLLLYIWSGGRWFGLLGGSSPNHLPITWAHQGECTVDCWSLPFSRQGNLSNLLLLQNLFLLASHLIFNQAMVQVAVQPPQAPHMQGSLNPSSPLQYWAPEAIKRASVPQEKVLDLSGEENARTILNPSTKSICSPHDRSHCSASVAAGPEPPKKACLRALFKERQVGEECPQWQMFTVSTVSPLESRLCML